MDLLLRFLIGGVFVSLFALIAECIQPKSFAGLLGAAPSIALASMILSTSHDGLEVVATQARYMVVGAIAFITYSLACNKLVKKPGVSIWISTGLLLVVWFTVSFLLAAVLR